MDLTPSQPVTPGDEPFGEPSGQTSEAAAPESVSGPGPVPAAARLHDDGTASRSSKEIGGKKFRVGTEDDYVPFRSRTKRRRRLIAAGVTGLVLVGAGAYGAVSLISSPSEPSAGSGSCRAKAGGAPNAVGEAGEDGADAQARTVAVAGGLPTAAQIKLNVYNSTERRGLAASTANALKQRGFAIGSVTNDPLKANLTVAAEVRGAVANASAMRVVAAEVVGARLHADSRKDNSVDLVLGAGFNALASPDQVSAALKQAQQTQAAPAKAASKCS